MGWGQQLLLLQHTVFTRNGTCLREIGKAHLTWKQLVTEFIGPADLLRLHREPSIQLRVNNQEF